MFGDCDKCSATYELNMHYQRFDTQKPSIFDERDIPESARTSTIGGAFSTCLNAGLSDTRSYMCTIHINVKVFLKTLIISYSLNGVIQDTF